MNMIDSGRIELEARRGEPVGTEQKLTADPDRPLLQQEIQELIKAQEVLNEQISQLWVKCSFVMTNGGDPLSLKATPSNNAESAQSLAVREIREATRQARLMTESVITLRRELEL